MMEKVSVSKTPHGCECVSMHIREKMSDLMTGLEFLLTYLDDLLIISNSTFEDNLCQLEILLQRLRRAGLKVNAEKSSFFAPEIEYLGYMLTKEGIKPVQKIVQAVYWISNPQLP